MKLVAQAGTCAPAAAAVIDDYTKSQDVDLQQRCLEFQAILTACPNLLPEILPVDASAEDVDVDPNLSFLDGYVSTALHNGARPYEKPEDDDDDDDDNYGVSNGATGSGFNLTPYAKPQTPSTMLHLSSGMGSGQQRVATPAGVSLPPGAHSGGGGGSAASQPQPPPDNIGLNVKNVANVWGRQSSPQHQAAAPAPAVPAPAASNAWGSSSVGGGGMGGGSNTYGGASSVASAPAPAPVKTAAQLERERQAAALFGGIVPGAPPPPPSQTSAPTSAPQPPAIVTAPPVSAPAPPPAPAAPEIDLLDLGGWGDDSPAPASEAPAVAATNFEDTFAPAPETSQAGPVVETVSDDNDDGGGLLGGAGSGATSSVAAPPAAAPPAPAMVDDDPFASAGLLSDVDTKPLPTLQRSAKFEYGSTPMAAMPINTSQFGQQWGACKATFPTSVQSSKISSLDQFMTLCADIGAHKIEAIAATNEGICAGMIGAQAIALIHCKVTPLGAGSAKLDVTVKSTDQQMGSALSMYIQTMLR